MSRLLYVAPRYPWPPRRGDQLRCLETFRLLAEKHTVTALVPERPAGAPPPEPPPGVEVRFYAPGGPGERLRGLASALGAGLPLQSGLFWHADLARRLRAEVPRHELVIFELSRLAPHLGDLGEAPLVTDFIDSLALNFERRAACDRPWLSPLWRLEGRRLARAEARLVARSRAALVVAERDRRHLASALEPALRGRLRVVPLLAPVVPSAPTARETETVILTGNLGYFPNRHGAAWFLREVWPRLSRRRPGAKLVLAGARPPASLARLARRQGARLLASPPDLRGLLASATVALAPLFAGSGLPIKILEAWAAGVPVVASPWAAAGTSAEPGTDLLVAEEPEEWVDALEALLGRPGERERLAAAGRARLGRDYGRDAVAGALEAALAQALAG